MRVYGAPISTIRGAADNFFGNMWSYFSNYLRFHVRMLCRALLCCSPKHTASRACCSPPWAYCSLSEFCFSGILLPLGNVGWLLPCQLPPSPGMMLPLDMMLSPKHAALLCMPLYHGHAAQAKNRHLIAPPMDHYFVTKGFFSYET